MLGASVAVLVLRFTSRLFPRFPNHRRAPLAPHALVVELRPALGTAAILALEDELRPRTGFHGVGQLPLMVFFEGGQSKPGTRNRQSGGSFVVQPSRLLSAGETPAPQLRSGRVCRQVPTRFTA